MLPEFGQIFGFLRDGDLHVMARHALVVGGRFHIGEQALGEVAGVDHHVAGPLAVRRPLDVLRAGGFLLAELLHRHHFHLRLRKPAEILR